MKMNPIKVILLLILFPISIYGASIKGVVLDGETPLAYATVSLNKGKAVMSTTQKGIFEFHGLDEGLYQIEVRLLSYEPFWTEVLLEKNKTATITCKLIPLFSTLHDVVITGSKTFKRKTDAPVIVHVLDNKTIQDVQACTISEGLRFQPGLRVETNCQTCNYTQLRMNGLTGGYAQVLINGRPIFSPLTGLYGLEQLPVNSINKIEVVRGGGSSLYGSSAVGGTVNILTKIPQKNAFDVSYTSQYINGVTPDHQFHANIDVVSKSKNSGLSLFSSLRNRSMYDHNQDDFSELPLLENRAFGAQAFFITGENQKLEMNTNFIREYRYGGDMLSTVPHLALQSEERLTSIWMGSADYQVNFNEGQSSIIAFAGFQQTDRSHFTGIQPDDEEQILHYLSFPPYGTSLVRTVNTGLQYNQEWNVTGIGRNVVTLGTEYIYDDVYDEIPSYNYLIEQTTHNVGAFAQSDWSISNKWNLLAGIRMDRHNLLTRWIASPRVSVLYKPSLLSQFRINYGKGFRAPQAFDADLHIAFAGGGISRVQLSPDLVHENAHSLSASWNYDVLTESYVAGFTLEGFYTRLQNGFITESIGEDEFGEVFRKRNGLGATVAGTTIEIRGNLKKQAQLEAGVTVQSSQNDEAVIYLEGLQSERTFIRTPDRYGYLNFTWDPSKRFSFNMNYVYTGKMLIPHFGGAVNQQNDEWYTSAPFHNLSLKGAYTIRFPIIKSNIQFYGGVKNVGNSYQSNFDMGKDRDSNFVFGPASPRTFFIGLRFFSL